MRKPFNAIMILLLITISFLAGSWYGRQETITNNPSAAKPKLVDVEKESPNHVSPGTVRITSERQQAIGIRIAAVEKKPVTQTIRILGRVAVDETRIYRINATVDGWVTETFPNATGNFVKKNETLAAFYSPEFLSAGQALLFALSSQDRVHVTGKETQPHKDQITQFNINIRQYRDSLKNLGMGDLQIAEMIQTRRYMENVNITSPADGIILVRNVSRGQRFDKGTELYRIVDLSRVWIQTDTYENEAQYLKPGNIVNVSLPGLKKTFKATVSNALPQFDEATRTLKVRLEANNPDYALRPSMFVDVELPITLPPAITAPADAVLDSGLKKTVFVDLGNGIFEPREVETGWRMGNQVEITKGLNPGEKIVVSGNFLIDSESRMELAAQGMVGTLSKDPVCGVDVSISKAEKARRKSTYQGKTYYFTSDECKQKFDKEPNRYVKK
jgi:RND family efflux transporter MFP subunit